MTDLNGIFDVVSRDLPAVGVDGIVIGGFAVNYHGYTRNTLDVDVMIVAEQLDTVKRHMMQAGFTNVSIQENVAFFSAPGSALRVDFLSVDGNTMRTLLANAISVRLHGREVRVPSLRDLLAMKIFSLSRDVIRRRAKDLPDIAYLTVIHGLTMETDIRPLCDRFGTPEVFRLINDQVEALQVS